MNSAWKVFVRLHNLVKIPPAACGESDDERVFSVAVRAVASDGNFISGCAEVHAEFTPRDIVRPTQAGDNNEDFLEVRLDSTLKGDSASATATTSTAGTTVAASAAEWLLPEPMVGLLLLVRERRRNRDEDTTIRVIGTAPHVMIDAADVLTRQKLATHILGTSMGQVGLSVSVAPSDTAGYRRRLTEFLTKYNPTGLDLVEAVVGSIGEVETFTKLFRKYGLVDYDRRVTDFFRVYGREHMQRVPELLQEWINHEEELVHHLVLDNGPEPDSIDTRVRLDAFLRAHSLTSGTPEVARAVKEFTDAPRELFAALITRYGPEPDPRTYLFPQTKYEATAQNINSNHVGVGEKHVDRKGKNMPPSVIPVTRTIPPPPPVLPTSRESPSEGPHLNHSTPLASHEVSRVHTSTMGAKGEPSWEDFCDILRRSGRHPSDVYYMREPVFGAILDELGYPAAERDALVLQWQRRVANVVREEPLQPGDAYYDTATAEVLAVVGLQPLQLESVSVMAVSNKEHSSRFAARLLSARARATERLVLIGDFNKLRGIVTHGVGDGDPSKPRGTPCAVFHRRPFLNWSRKQATCILVCDVVVGSPFVCPSLVKTARDATTEFREEWDSCVFHDAGGGQAVAVYDAQQVLPRYMVQCHVDVSATPCPAHPTRAVEYYVLDANTFACSRCVVLGAHRGREVLTIEEASVQARARLADHQREAVQLTVEFDTLETELNRTEADMRTAPRRVTAEREMERIRREAEERIAAIARSLEHDEAVERAEIQRRREQATRAREAANALAESVEVALQQSKPMEIVAALQRIAAADELSHLREQHQHQQDNDVDVKGDRKVKSNLNQHAESTTRQSNDHSECPTHRNGSADMNPVHGSNSNRHSMSNTRHGSTLPSTADHDNGNTSHLLPEALPRDSSKSVASAESSALYAKYLAITSASASAQPLKENPPGVTIGNVSRASSDRPHSEVARRAKEDVTRGWSLYRQGDRDAARQLWENVYERHSAEAVGARARAYIAEALERDYESAAEWYDAALQRDPRDALTLYNYGVLLEALLGRRQEALTLFDRAHALGDSTAGRRAQQLRTALQMTS